MRSLGALATIVSLGSLHAQNYVRDVYPIWQQHCLGCHASGTKMGSLDIETWEGVQNGGNHGTIVVPGDPKASRLYTMLMGEGQPAMPMDGKVLSAPEIEVVRQWIANGATPPTTAEIAMLKAKAAGENTPIFSLAWRPRSTEVAVGRSHVVDLLHPVTKAIRATLEGHADAIRALAFSRDGQRLAAAGGRPGQNGEVLIWNVAAQSILVKINGHRDVIQTVAFSPDARRIATGSADKLVKLWDTATGLEIRTLSGHLGAVHSVAFTPDGQRLISGSADGTVRIWSSITGDQQYPLSGDVLALSPDGQRLATAGRDRKIRIWALGEKSALLLQPATALVATVIALAWSPDGNRIASADRDQAVRVFSAHDMSELQPFPLKSDLVTGITFSSDGARIVVSRFDGTLDIID